MNTALRAIASFHFLHRTPRADAVAFREIPDRLGFPGVIEVTDGEGEVWYAT